MAKFKYEYVAPADELRTIEDGLRRLEQRHQQESVNHRVSLGTDGSNATIENIEREITALREERDAVKAKVDKSSGSS